MKIRVIITGATGMVGKSVLTECFVHPSVESILIINRKTTELKHPKLKEIIHKDFLHLASIKSELTGYNACFFCMGVSSLGMSEEKYTELTYGITSHFAKVLKEQNPEMVFNYVSGAGTDSSEQGKVMWARVKGKTENMLLKMRFKDAYLFRLGAMLPERGVKSNTRWINILLTILRPLYPLMKRMRSVTTSSKIGLAMINSVLFPQDLKHLKTKDINDLANKSEL